jgi:hypothetical protein
VLNLNLNELLKWLRLEDIVYWGAAILIIVVSTIRQLTKQGKLAEKQNNEIIENLTKLEKQSIKLINTVDLNNQEIKTIKKYIGVLEHRVTRLEDSHVTLYKKLDNGGKENDNN